MIAALIVGSGLLLLEEKGPLVWGVPIIGLTFFALSCTLGVLLISLVVKSDKRSRHILNSIPTVIYELAITAKGFPTQWVSDSVKKSLVTKSRKRWPLTGGSTVCIPMTRRPLSRKRRS